jgi:ribonuclease HI
MNGPVQLATDGACLGNPGPGGWAWTTELTDASGGQHVTMNCPGFGRDSGGWFQAAVVASG